MSWLTSVLYKSQTHHLTTESVMFFTTKVPNYIAANLQQPRTEQDKISQSAQAHPEVNLYKMTTACYHNLAQIKNST